MDLKIGGPLGFWLLNTLSKESPPDLEPGPSEDEGVAGAPKLERFFGPGVWEDFAGRCVLDYGCGPGREAVAVAERGAGRVYGVDIQDRFLQAARELAARRGVADRCVFLSATKQGESILALYGRIECVYCLDSFEHIADPQAVLAEIYSLLEPGGRLLVSFGPPWKHPYGAHMRFFNSLPWLHFIFSEETIMAVRAAYRRDGAKRFEEVDGGLNRMTVARFLDVVKNSPCQLESLRAIPIRGLTWLVKNPVTREYFTSVVQCVLSKPVTPASK